MNTIYRPRKFSEVKGNKKVINFITERIKTGTFPQFTLLYGEEGLGKTTLAKLTAVGLTCTSDFKPCYCCNHCITAVENVIDKNINTNDILTFKMSIEGGLKAAKEVLANLNTSFNTGPKVIILEECHRMSNEAQDALLTDTEYLPANVYVIACTTDLSRMQKSFLSRAVIFNLNRLTGKEIVSLLKEEASRRNLILEGGDTMLEIIATWAEYKPRAALKVLEAMGSNTTVTIQDIKDFISFVDTKDVLPIIASYSSSVLIGIEAINNLATDMNTHNSLLMILEEVVKIAFKQTSKRLSQEDALLIKEAVFDTDPMVFLNFLYEVAKIDNLTKPKLMAAYLKNHPMLAKIDAPKEGVLESELRKKFMETKEDLGRVDKAPVTSMADLISRGTLIE